MSYSDDLVAFPAISHMIMPNGNLDSLTEYVWYEPGDDYITLDGRFTIDQLIQISKYVEKYKELDDVST